MIFFLNSLHVMWPTDSSAQEVNTFSSSNVSIYTILSRVLDSDSEIQIFFLFIYLKGYFSKFSSGG